MKCHFLFAILLSHVGSIIASDSDDLSPMFACIEGDITGWVKPTYPGKKDPSLNHVKRFKMIIKTKLSGFMTKSEKGTKDKGYVSINEGTSCDDIGEPYWKSEALGDDDDANPWPMKLKVTKTGKTMPKKIIEVNNGYPKRKLPSGNGGNVGKLAVIYREDGETVGGCGVLVNKGKASECPY